jgi:LysM repeat protein
MKIKHFLLVFLIGSFVIMLSACKLPASSPPEPTPTTEEGGFPIPGAEQETMGLFETIATQTAMALAGETAPGTTPPAPAVEGQATAAEGEEPAEAPTQEPATEQPAAETQPEAPMEPTFVLPEPTPGLPETYTLQKGEFPYCIARRFDINPTDLLNANGLAVNTQIQPGYVLIIPQSASSWPGERSLQEHPTYYTVRSGETIFSIACEFGDVDPYMIALANELDEPYSISTGETLYIP